MVLRDLRCIQNRCGSLNKFKRYDEIQYTDYHLNGTRECGGLSYRGKVQYPRAVLCFLNGRMGLMYMQCIEVGSWVDCPITSYEVQ